MPFEKKLLLGAFMNQAKWFEAKRLFRGVVAATLYLMALSQLGDHRVSAADEVPDLETIRVAVDSYTQSIKTLEGKFLRSMSHVSRRMKVGPGIRMEGLRVDATFSADIAEGKFFLDERKSYWLPGKQNGEHVSFETHEVRAFDGMKAYSLVYSPVKSPVESAVPADIPMELIVGAENEIDREYVPWDFAGLRLLGMGKLTLAGMLRDPTIKLSDQFRQDGMYYLYQDDGNISQFRSSPFGAVIDPAHDYLPRSIWITETLPDEATRLAHGFEVFEFRRFPDAQGANEKWFPVRGRVKSWLPETYDLEVTELKVNQPIDAGRFSIREEDLPDGVKLVTGGVESYTGGRKDLWQERQRLLDQNVSRIDLLLAPPPSAALIPPPAPTVAAEFFSGFSWQNWLVVVAALGVIVAAATSSLRGRRRRAD